MRIKGPHIEAVKGKKMVVEVKRFPSKRYVEGKNKGQPKNSSTKATS